MSDYRISDDTARILPGAVGNELQRLPMRLAGLALVTMAVVGWISLLTWSFNDPSLNRATNGAPSNFLGAPGASLADILFQILGLTAIVFFLPPAVWGIKTASGDFVSRPRHRLAMWTLAMFFGASALSIVPKAEAWPLAHGLGGVVGDFGQVAFLRISGFLDPAAASILAALIAGTLGLWTLLRACGLTRHDFRMILPLASREDADDLEPEGNSWLSSGVGYAVTGFNGVRDRLTDALERQKAGSKRPSQQYWLDDEEDEDFPPLPPLKPKPRSKPGAFDPRFGGYDLEERHIEIPRMKPARAAPRHAVSAPVEDEDRRIEPYFTSLPAADRSRRDAPVQQAAPIVQMQPLAPQPHVPQPQQGAPHPHPHHDPRHNDYYAGSAPGQYAHPQANHYYDGHQPDHAAQHAHAPQAAYPYETGPNGHYHHGDAQYVPAPPHVQHHHNGHYDAPPPQAPVAYAPQPDLRREPLRQAPATQMPSRERSAAQHRSAFDGHEAEEFELPSMDLLSPPPPRHLNPELSDAALGRRAEMLQGVLEDFGIKGQITGVHPGPVITLYELEPARGTKSSRVIGLADDIARSMSAVSARVAVIPGRDAIGIELPNQNREVVYLRELLEAKEFSANKGHLNLALGKTIGGDPVSVDLARMPHLLIAGTTGSGKSVAINTMILSLLFRLPPEQCRFLMIDPKMLELSVYDGIPHLLTPVVTDPQKAIVALKWTVNEMNSRYERMCKVGVRNIHGFNQKVARYKRTGQPLARTVQTGFDEDTGSPIYEREDVDCRPMPYIVVVIDEMADLMMVAGKDIEFAVQRLSQMARAAGIHLIMATQRPSVDVITGTIKANFPSRISFQVTSKIDSRTILGEHGAEQLLGAGDMLTMAAGGRIMRAHGPFVSDGEVENIVNYLRSQGEPEYLDGLLDDDFGSGGGASGDGAVGQSGDDIYDQAIAIVLRDKRATTSYLQRRLGIGYNRAASLIERMEADGIISAPNRTGKREVLLSDES